MTENIQKSFSSIGRRVRIFDPDLVFPFLTILGLAVFLLLARHTSTSPSLLGRWSWRFAALLVFQGLLTVVLGLLAFPSVRALLLRAQPGTVSRRKAWGLLAAGLALLPVTWLLLRKSLFPDRDPVLVLFAGLILLSVVTIVTTVMWRTGATALAVSLPPNWPVILLLLFVGQLFLAVLFSGQVPPFHLPDEARIVGNSLRQFFFPDRFVLLLPDRNASTWFYFQGYWVPSGAWMSTFGAGIQQLRALNLFVAWLAMPFLYLTARRLFGPVPAVIAAVCAIVFPIHFVSARADIWVATSTTIAFYFFLAARSPTSTRVGLPAFFCGFLALSAIDGHFYGGAFALMFCLLHLPTVVRLLRRKSQGQENRALAGFIVGICLYSLVWFTYHVVVPGIEAADIPGLVGATLDIEAGLGEATHGTGLTVENLIKFVQLFLYANPYVLAASSLGLLVTIRTGGPLARASLLVALGAGCLILLSLAHFTKFYIVFWLPFMCLWTGVGLARLFQIPAGLKHQTSGRLSFGTLYVLSSLVVLCTIQLVETAETYRHEFERASQVTDTGREIDRMLPQEDIAIAGSPEISLGMLWRLNYGAFCAFTLDDPTYWPLGQPQAVISTPGWDKGCHLLADWLTERDFRPARCFTGHDFGEGVTILYLSPELMTPDAAVDCTPAQLSLLEETA